MGHPMPEPVAPPEVFSVGRHDLVFLVGREFGLLAHHVLEDAGIKAVAMEHLTMLTPAERLQFMLPTGDSSKPLLPFPCTLAQLFQFWHDDYGPFLNELLVAWMKERVVKNRRRLGGEWLDAIADDLFVLHLPQSIELLEMSEDCTIYPSDAIDLLDLLAWCDRSEVRDAGVLPPTNEGIVTLIEQRMIQAFSRSAERRLVSTEKPLGTRSRNTHVNIIVALAIDILVRKNDVAERYSPSELADRVRDIKKRESALGESGSRRDLHDRIRELTSEAGIPLAIGKGGAENIERAVVRVHKGGYIESATPLEKAIRGVLHRMQIDEKGK